MTEKPRYFHGDQFCKPVEPDLGTVHNWVWSALKNGDMLARLSLKDVEEFSNRLHDQMKARDTCSVSVAAGAGGTGFVVTLPNDVQEALKKLEFALGYHMGLANKAFPDERYEETRKEYSDLLALVRSRLTLDVAALQRCVVDLAARLFYLSASNDLKDKYAAVINQCEKAVNDGL